MPATGRVPRHQDWNDPQYDTLADKAEESAHRRGAAAVKGRQRVARQGGDALRGAGMAVQQHEEYGHDGRLYPLEVKHPQGTVQVLGPTPSDYGGEGHPGWTVTHDGGEQHELGVMHPREVPAALNAHMEGRRGTDRMSMPTVNPVQFPPQQ